MTRHYKGPARRDLNHSDIAYAARQIPGLVVEQTHEVGSRSIPGWPDLILAWRGRLIPVEIKSGDEGLTPAEAQLHQRWQSAGVTVRETSSEAIIETT